MSDTPETDAFYATFADVLASPSQDEWLERLKRYERQRDGLLEALESLARHRPMMGSTGDYREGQMHILESIARISKAAITAVKEGKP